MPTHASTATRHESVPRLVWGEPAPMTREAGTSTPLTADNVSAWLSSRDLLAGRRLVQLDRLSGRAFAALVRFDDGSALFLKQPIEAIPPVGALREGQLLRLVATSEALRGVRCLLPRTVLYDEADNVVVTEGLLRHRPLRDATVPPPEPLLQHTARCLAALHGASSGGASDTSAYLSIHPVFDFSRVTPHSFARAPGDAFGAYLAAMQALEGPLGALADGWRPTCLIHGDFRDDNVMVDTSAEHPSIRFVDWELGGWGDPMWDLGAFIGQLLYHWVESIQAAEGDFSSWVRGATVPFPRIQQASRTILTSYAEASGRTLRGTDGFAARALQFAGLFLLHRVLGSLESVGTIHAPAFCSLQVGRTLLTQPARATGILA
ncbi:MAG: aminoglycoside phosphotransferase family protein [Myxococcota bacterium]